MKEAIGYHKYKSVRYKPRVLAHVESLAADPNTYSGDFTPLDILDTLLDREISHTEPMGRAFSVTALPVSYNKVNPLREPETTSMRKLTRSRLVWRAAVLPCSRPLAVSSAAYRERVPCR